MNLVLVGPKDSDLCRILQDNDVAFECFGSMHEAVAHAPESSGILVLAGGYPETLTPIDLDALAVARQRHQRMYVEFPDALPDMAVGETRDITWERGVVASDAFPDLEKLRIVMIHGCRYVVAPADDPHIVLARVAGFDHAVCGLPEETAPVLFEHPRGDLLVATTALSQVQTGRYAPAEAWMAIWEWILSWVTRADADSLTWQPTVRPTHGKNDRLGSDAEANALRRGVAWYGKANVRAPRLEEGGRSARD